jgi:hypothetical protein
MMVNNSTNIKKNEQSPLSLSHWTQKKTKTYDTGNPGPGLEHAQKGMIDKVKKSLKIPKGNQNM